MLAPRNVTARPQADRSRDERKEDSTAPGRHTNLSQIEALAFSSALGL